MKREGCRVGPFPDETLDADLALLLLPERGRGQDLVDHSRTLSPGEKRVEIVAAQKPAEMSFS